MMWDDITSKKMKGFSRAKVVLLSRDKKWLLALWDHSRATGWFLYEKYSDKNNKYSFRSNLGDITIPASTIQEQADICAKHWENSMAKIKLDLIRRKMARAKAKALFEKGRGFPK